MRRVVLLAVLAALLAPAAAHAANRAGVAVVDATWHVGASAGQFTEDTGPFVADGVDPQLHAVKKRRSDGVGLRSSVRALVVEDGERDRVAVVANDLYLAQDLLGRRVAELLADHDRRVARGELPGRQTGITADTLAITASHNHNTPFATTPGWGTAIFQDVIDVRHFEFMAQRMTEAVVRAAQDLVPVRLGGATRTFDAIQSHTYGPKVADDGTPAGQPWDHTTKRVSVLALDDVRDPRRPRPLANWVVFGLHPEFTWGYDLINGDFTHATARMVDRELGTTSLFSQRETGSSGPHKDERVHPASARREFEDNGFAQLDRGSRLLADAVLAARRDAERGAPQHPDSFLPFTSDFDVRAVARYVAPPLTKPIAGVSNCNTAAWFHGEPRIPVLGFPDCASVGATPLGALTRPLAPLTGPLYDQLKRAGIPIPDAISATAFTAVEETAAVRLQAFALGDAVATFCPCEQLTDTAINVERRLNRVAGDRWDGFDWTATTTPSGRDWCVRGGDGRWTCADPRAPAKDLAPVGDEAYRRMRAQIHNDARGWEADLPSLLGEAEPPDPAKVKGNFTHEEFPQHGFAMVLSVGMANDYWGYQPEYREQRGHDHYRKALSGLGPHGSDFLATRLARLGASLNGGPPLAATPQDRIYELEQARAQAVSTALGVVGRAVTRLMEASQPPDAGPPAIAQQPADVRRFGAAHVTWTGGSNWTDLPDVRVERFADGAWRPYGDLTGDVQLMVRFPKPAQLGDVAAGRFAWRWTAGFEAFGSDVAQPDATGTMREATPAGTYRFVVAGRHRTGRGAVPRPYRLTSERFTVSRWDGLEVRDVRLHRDRTVSFRVAPIDFPDSHPSPFRFIKAKQERFTYDRDDPDDDQVYCSRCTFRPWADTGSVAGATVRILRPGRRTLVARAVRRGGRWRTTRRLRPGERAFVAAGGVRDRFGDVNGAASPRVRAPRPRGRG
ncbi:hypothetical protein [Conexibacter sp. SYSU D00693]|uniref:hypothetical protein n=1 Tax=Conexibacter sp. SYSU D00693 TaxID=2812560 RepID=UPI00196A71A8|nr:hypothetical protein [Conexibacter sp. SYSU D00693]